MDIQGSLTLVIDETNDFAALAVLCAQDAVDVYAFLPEILYAGLRAMVNLEDWKEVKIRSEELMGNYPDYRMMWAIEDFYKRALEKLSKDKADK